MQVYYYTLISVFLLCTGIYLLLTKTNPVMALMGVELIFNAANINLVAFSKSDQNKEGWFFSLFLFVIIACESVVALIIFYLLNKQSGNSELDKADTMKG